METISWADYLSLLENFLMVIMVDFYHLVIFFVNALHFAF
jgi:hypothetical protein